MGDHEDFPYIVIEQRRGDGVSPFLFGALLGVGAALLFAPRSGRETQEEIRTAAMRLRESAEGRVNEARSSVTGAVDRTRGVVTDRISAVTETIQSRAEQARHAIEAGREAARQARSELERRVDDAKVAYRSGLAATRSGASETPLVEEVVITSVVVEEVPLGEELA